MDFEQDIKNCIKALEAGGVVLYPTDTVWGLGCDALDEQAIDKIFTVKKRPRDKSLIILLADARDILQYIAAPPPDIIDMIGRFTKPTTVIYNGALGFPDNLVHEDGSIAIRVTTDPFCKALIKRFQKPIVSTSANFSGEPTPATFDLINKELIASVDYTVQYRQDDRIPRQSSQLVRIDDEGNMEVLRP